MEPTLNEVIDNAKRLVFFGGAGVSTESGIPDFRSADGIYSQEYRLPPEVILSRRFFNRNTKAFYEFYRDKLIYENAKPNAAHIALAKLEQAGKLFAVITQNIDGLHQAAGSVNVIELHGSMHRNYCKRCNRFYGLDHITSTTGIPLCECGGVIKPDVVLYDDNLNQEAITQAVDAIAEADVLIIAGTSLSVYPAAQFIDFYKGDKLIIINRTPTHADDRARFLLRENVGSVLEPWARL